MNNSPAAKIRRQSNSRVFGGLLFWSMILFGAVLVVPTLVLPPWIRFEEKKREKAAQIEHLAALRTELEIVRKQNEYRDDPEYLAQLERMELGAEPVGAERITIDPRILEETRRELAEKRTETPSNQEDDPLVQTARHVFTEYPVTQAYLQPYFREILLAVGGGSILLAIVLLSQSARPPD